MYHTETSQLTCNPNRLICFYIKQAFNERYFWIDVTTNKEFGIFSYVFFCTTSAKDVKRSSRGYQKFYEFHLSIYQNTQTKVLSIVFVVFAFCSS